MRLSFRPPTPGRMAGLLAWLLGLTALAAGLAAVLPFRTTGFLVPIRGFLSVATCAFGAAWVILSLLAMPRAFAYLLRRPPPAAPHRRRAALALLALACLPLALGWAGLIMARMPHPHRRLPVPPLTAGQIQLRDALRAEVETLAGEIGDRNAVVRNRELGAAADHIEKSLAAAGYTVRRQQFEIDWLPGRPVCNLEVELRGATRPDEIVVIGAHYDSVAGSPGANDNASGVAALLALARSCASGRPDRTLRCVAFVNEEPLFFRTRHMGSLVYARACRQRGDNIVAMLCLETLGCYADQPGSQRYPLPVFKWFFPDAGNFLAFIGNYRSRALVLSASASFQSAAVLPSEAAALPGWITGVGWSDHWSFWQAGYPAVMATDTAPFRYRWYHTAADTPDQLDYDRLALAVAGLEQVVAGLAQQSP